MRFVLAVLLATVAGAGPAWASCDDAVDTYNSSISEVDYQLRRYANCLSNSAGEDDCSSEFRRLRNAQGEFETAVSNYRNECDY